MYQAVYITVRVVGSHRLPAVHRCHICSVHGDGLCVCLSVCVMSTTVICTKQLNRSRCLFGAESLDSFWPKDPRISLYKVRGLDPHEKGNFDGEHLLAPSLRTYEWLFALSAAVAVHSSPARRTHTVKNIRISTYILWRVFHVWTEPVPNASVSVIRRNNAHIYGCKCMLNRFR